MASYADEDDEFSGSDGDEGLDEDLEALRRACILTGTDINSLQPPANNETTARDSDDDDDDMELLRGIQRRFSAYNHAEAPLSLKPLSTLPPALSDQDDDDDDDFEILRAIQKRFSGYDDQEREKNGKGQFMSKVEHVHSNGIALEKETSSNVVVDSTNISEGFQDSLDFYNTSQSSESIDNITHGDSPSPLVEWHQPDDHGLAVLPCSVSSFPKAAQMFVDAIKKNRACQKFFRSKLMQIEARIEENKALRQRVKLLRDFQVSCKKRTGRALSQKKDARVQLISVVKPRANSKVNVKNGSPLYYGPNENSIVTSYRLVLEKFPISLHREKWSHEERENLTKGIKQQFQEQLLQKSVDLISDVEGSSSNSNDIDSVIASIRGLDITPETIRSFLPKVDWEKLAFTYITGRFGAECEARWLNCEDPLINRHSWSRREDKELLHIIQERGISDWIDIAVLLGTNRTPFQCLVRYQRSLNASILKREWTEDDDDKLRAAVETFGEGNWQLVASTLEGRTGTQCSNSYAKFMAKFVQKDEIDAFVTANESHEKKMILLYRWIKSLHPARQRVGRWTLDEDKRLKVTVMLFGPKNWNKIAQFVHGRTHVQCRERWVNSLDPHLRFGEWTQEEDSKLDAAVEQHRDCWSKVYWSKVAACVPPRTDNQCKRRWRDLHPLEWSWLQAARKIQSVALISNFVDRESERPALGPNDFVPLAITNAIAESENVNHSGQRKRKSRSKKPMKEAQSCPGEVPLLTNGTGIGTYGGNDSVSKKRVIKPWQSKEHRKPTQDCARNIKVGPSGCMTKRKRPFGRRKRKSSARPEAASRDDDINEVEAFGDGAKNKNSHALRSKRTKYDRLMRELLEMSDSGQADTLRGNDASLRKKKDIKRSLEKCRGTNKCVSNHIFKDEVEDEMTLSLFLQNQRKKRKVYLPETGSFIVEPSAPPGFENLEYSRYAS